MEETAHAVIWEAPEHTHIEKTGDWFWALGLIAIAGSAAAFVLGNMLFGIVILLAAVTMIIHAHYEPRVIPFSVTSRGIRIDRELYPYTSLESYCLEEEHPLGPQLLVKSQKTFMPLLIIPIPEEYIHEIEDLISMRLPEEKLEEPFSHRILEFFGF